MITEEKHRILAEFDANGPIRGRTKTQLSKEYQVRGAVLCRPLQETASLERALEKLTLISKIIIAVPKIDADPAAPLRGVSDTVDVVVKVSPKYRRDRDWRERIPEMLTSLSSTSGKIVGERNDGIIDSVPIDDEFFALEHFDETKLVAAEHLDQDNMCSAPVFRELVQFMESRPRLFGA